MISALRAKLVIKGNCAIADGLSAYTGNHARIKGRFITDITESNKNPMVMIEILLLKKMSG